MTDLQESEDSTVLETTHAGVFVLSNRVLWDRITDFMTGYPFAVLQFYQESDPLTRLDRRADGIYSDTIGYLTREGVLPHLAIAVNDPEMLQLLHRLSENPQYQRDLRFSFRKVMNCAVLYNNVEMLEMLDKLKAGDRSWTQDANLARLALERDDPNVHVLDWLFERLPPMTARVAEKYMRRHTERGDLDVVRWLHERTRNISQTVMDDAAEKGHLHVLRYFYEQSERQCSSDVVEVAAVNGFVDTVKFALENQKQPISLERVIPGAALHGHFELVRYFVGNNISFDVAPVVNSAATGGNLEIVKYLSGKLAGCCTAQAMCFAGQYGHLDVLKYLYENRSDDCYPRTLTYAAANGHLEVVRFLHETCGLSCSQHDLCGAAENGHFEVVKFVHQNCPEECSPRAMDGAAAGGHLEVVEFLHFNCTGGCTASALEDAASHGHLGVLKFLCEHRSEGNLMFALTEAIDRRDVKVVKALHSHLKAGDSLYGTMEAVARGYKWGMSDIIPFLCENQEIEEKSFLLQAVINDSSAVAGLVMPHATLEELAAAKESALKLGYVRMAHIIARGISKKTGLSMAE